MDRTNSFTGGQRPASTSGAPFAYQQRLLERTSSTRGGSGSLSRASSQASNALLSSPTGTPSIRRWTPSHRVGGSLDMVRGKWEERLKSEGVPESPSRTPSDETGEGLRSSTTYGLDSPRIPDDGARTRFTDSYTHIPKRSDSPEFSYTSTPTALKRHTLPAPIIAAALSPNNTGVTVENPDSPTSPYSTPTPRIHFPVTSPTDLRSGLVTKRASHYSIPIHDEEPEFSSVRLRRSNTLESIQASSTGSSTASDATSSTSVTSTSSRTFQSDASSSNGISRRTSSLYGNHRPTLSSPSPSQDKYTISRARSSTTSNSSVSPAKVSGSDPPAPSSSRVSDAMSPKPYRSSYMNKKASTYGETLIVGRRLGRHLPRIASGDAPEDWEEEPKADTKADEGPPPEPPETWRIRVAERERRSQEWRSPSPEKPRRRAPSFPTAGNPDDVAGIPGRMRLSRDKTPSAPSSPLPSARLSRGLWADVQRHLLQAYEYLCHVGEAQQWIEGCLGEELGFGVVEMEERMRNGVVLAKLVRVFQGEAVVRRIYEAPKLDFRHSDNVNVFFNFVRHVGLPESFTFELTDLYEKKNFPKVIYCIHALSHLLARRGLAERIGNLVGHLQFSDDQLQQTQKGLKDSGVAMPNFGNVGKELAKEINEEPEEEPETEDERRDRLLMENEDSIVAAQAAARAFLVRKAQATQRGRIQFAERYVPGIQARARGVLFRRQMERERSERADMRDWVVVLQARARGAILRREWASHLRGIDASEDYVIKTQAQARGVLQRRKYLRIKAAMRSYTVSVVKLQSLVRARIAQQSHKEVTKNFMQPVITSAIVAVQALARGILLRRKISTRFAVLDQVVPSIVLLQAQARGVLIRRRVGSQLAKLDDVSDVVVRIQTAVRTFLVRKRLLALIRGLRNATPGVIALQATARAALAKRRFMAKRNAFREVKIVTSVGGLQAFARAAITRNRHREQTKRLEFVQPDVVGIQAVARGVLARMEYIPWRDHIRRSHPVATMLQALLRGATQRRRFRARIEHYRSNLDKVIQIQSLFRAKETREQYRQLTVGTNVTVGTIKNFVHLLDDSESDFQEEIKVERLRQSVVKRIRENQALESHVDDLDVKIALVVQNVKSFEELLKARRRYGTDSAALHAARASILAAHGDPFAGPSTLDHSAKRKHELYQQLFYLLQTRGEYIARLFTRIKGDDGGEKTRKTAERVVLTLFGYGHDRREEYLLLKLFQTAIRDEILTAGSIQEVTNAHPMFITIAVKYVRPKQTVYVREALQAVINELKDGKDISLESDPVAIYRARIDVEEMRSGAPSPKPKDVTFREALQDPDTRGEYIRHLQLLQWWTEAFVTALTQSTQRMPYGIRHMARETLVALRDRFPDAPEEVYTGCIARLLFYRYINPAIMTPETFDVVSQTLDTPTRKNLNQISRMLEQITLGCEFGDENPCFVPVNDYVRKAAKQWSSWLLEVANVQDAESQYHAHEFLDATAQPKSIWISPNEVYTMHSLLSQYLDHLAPQRDDGLRIILTDLDGVPHIGDDELNDARDAAIELPLTNRFADVKDPNADLKALWVQAKRAVLAILRVQPAKDLVESLMQPVTEEHEQTWDGILTEMTREQKHQRRMPSTTHVDSAYRLEDIRSMTFREVKAHAIFFLLELEKRGQISRIDGYQGILNAIAGDVRSKNRRRIQRQHEKESMEEALTDLAGRKKWFEEQITSYHNYVETAMSTMQRGKGKKRFIMPFTKQYFHTRELQKAGKTPQFGSYKYSAQHFYDKGILLSIDQYSPRQFDKIDIVLSSNKVGIFTVEVFNNALGITNRVAHADVKMEDLLVAQFENRASYPLFNGMAKFNLNLLLWQINKKFYV